MCSSCFLREIGISMTRPTIKTPPFSRQDGEIMHGEGMEWHSDGPKGECTILMGLEDIALEQGCLRCIPNSHIEAVDGKGHKELTEERKMELNKRQIEYCYRAGLPMLIDARTLHSVSPNKSNTWRVICWFIYDSFD